MKKIGTLLCAMLMLSAASVSAAKMDISQDSGIVTVSIDVEREEKGVAVLLRSRDEAGDVIFLDDSYTDAKGKYSCKFDASDAQGILTVTANVIGDGLIEEDTIVRTVGIENEIIDIVSKENVGKDEIKAVIEKYWVGLEFEDDIFNSLSDKDAVYEFVANDPASKSVKNYKEFQDAFYTAVIICKYGELQNKNDISGYLRVVPYSDIVGSRYVDNYEFLNDTVKGKATEGMAASYTDSKKFLSDIEFYLLRNCIRYSALWNEIQPVLSGYAGKIGLQRAVTAMDCKNVIGQSYSSYSEVLGALTPTSTGGGGGGGGSSGGGGGGGSSGRPQEAPGFSLIETPQNPTIEEEKEEKIGEVSFVDMENYKWAEPFVQHVYELGIVSGYGDGTFRPEKNVSREEAVKMLMALMKAETFNLSTVLPFEDVPKDRWSYPYILAAYENKVVSGMSDTLFGVSREVSRQEMAVMAWNVLKAMGVSEKSRLVFNDGDEIADWAKESVEILGGCDVIHGRTAKDGFNFEPKAPVTRAEMAVIISNMAKLLP